MSSAQSHLVSSLGTPPQRKYTENVFWCILAYYYKNLEKKRDSELMARWVFLDNVSSWVKYV